MLERVQALDGFSDALKGIGPIPACAGEWRWSDVLEACYRRGPGPIRWRDGIPEHAPAPSDDDLWQLEEYRDRVDSFATSCVFGAEWSARATHDGLQRGGPIALPRAPERTFVIAPVSVDFREKKGAPVSYREIGLLREYVELLDSQPLVEPTTDGIDRRAQAVALLRQHRQADLADALEKRDRLMEPSGEKRDLRQSRAGMWDDAIGHVAAGLLGRARTSNESQALKRCRPFLNAAVNAEWNAELPIELTDSRRWFTEIEPLLRQAGKATRAADEVRRSDGAP